MTYSEQTETKVTINGWVTRSKNGTIITFSDSPECKRGHCVWYYKEESEVVDLTQTGLFDNDLFPSVTWESEPQKVKIEITLIGEKGG